MSEIDLEAIRARDRDYDDIFEEQSRMSPDIAHRLVAWPVADRRALLAAYDALAARLAEVHKTLAPLVDDDNRPVEALARYAVARIAEAEALRKDAERWRHEWQRECADTDLLLQGMGLCPSEYRSEGGSLLLGRISHKLKQRGGLS